MLLVLCFNWIHAFALLGRSMQHFNAAIRIMRRLHELGVQFYTSAKASAEVCSSKSVGNYTTLYLSK